MVLANKDGTIGFFGGASLRGRQMKSRCLMDFLGRPACGASLGGRSALGVPPTAPFSARLGSVAPPVFVAPDKFPS